MTASSAVFRRRPSGGATSRRWWIVALVLFLVVDVALVAVALRANSVPPGAQVAAPPPTLPKSSSSTEPAVIAPSAAVPVRVLAAVSEDVAWRGQVGTCPAGSTALEYTTDGGATWKNVDPVRETSATTLVRIIPESTSVANVVTLDSGCSPQLMGTFVAGDVWEDYSSNLGSYWYLHPANRGIVHSPNGDIAAPCASATIAPRSTTEAAVLCEDQSIFLTTDGGTVWSPAVAVPGATAIAGTTDGYAIAVAGEAGCGGISVVTLTDVEQSTTAGCHGDAPGAGETALSVADDGTVWLWAGTTFGRSIDGGLTWL